MANKDTQLDINNRERLPVLKFKFEIYTSIHKSIITHLQPVLLVFINKTKYETPK
jgi:hypothetical protein